MSTELAALVAELRELEEAADAAPWYLVGKPWMADDQCDTYAISGSRDPHGGTPVLSWIEPDLLDPENEPDENEHRARTNLACAVAARNALPALLSALETAQARIATLEAALVLADALHVAVAENEADAILNPDGESYTVREDWLDGVRAAWDANHDSWAKRKMPAFRAALRAGKETPGDPEAGLEVKP